MKYVGSTMVLISLTVVSFFTVITVLSLLTSVFDGKNWDDVVSNRALYVADGESRGGLVPLWGFWVGFKAALISGLFLAVGVLMNEYSTRSSKGMQAFKGITRPSLLFFLLFLAICCNVSATFVAHYMPLPWVVMTILISIEILLLWTISMLLWAGVRGQMPNMNVALVQGIVGMWSAWDFLWVFDLGFRSTSGELEVMGWAPPMVLCAMAVWLLLMSAGTSSYILTVVPLMVAIYLFGTDLQFDQIQPRSEDPPLHALHLVTYIVGTIAILFQIGATIIFHVNAKSRMAGYGNAYMIVDQQSGEEEKAEFTKPNPETRSTGFAGNPLFNQQRTSR